MRVVDALDLFEDEDADEIGYKYRQTVKKVRRNRTELRAQKEALRAQNAK